MVIGWPFSGLWWTLNPFAFARWSEMVGSYLAYLLMLQVTCWLRTCVKCHGLYLASLVFRVILWGFLSRVPSECQPILDQGLPSACRNGTWIEDADFCIIVCPKSWAEDCILVIYIQCWEVTGVIGCLVLCEWYSQGYDHTLFVFSGLTRNWHNICLVTLCDAFVTFFSILMKDMFLLRGGPVISACFIPFVNLLLLFLQLM